MNKSIETQKIKVNNGQELITKAQEYKNSGGEWKLREWYFERPKGKNRKKNHNWGIIISNGEKEVNICSLGKGPGKDGIIDEAGVRDQFHELFPRAKEGLHADGDKEHDSYGGRPTQSKLDHETSKLVKESDGECWLYRYLVAESFRHLELIIKEYFHENEAKIYNSPNRDFSNWVEIIDGQDGNMYLYVGEKNDGGGREIKIGIKKDDFEKEENRSIKGGEKHTLEVLWDLLIMSAKQPMTPTEKENFYKDLEKTFQEQWPHREMLCRNYWESVRERMEEAFNYWHEKSRQNQHWDHEANERGILAKTRVAEIKEELSKNKNIKICSDECQHLWENNPSAPTSPKSDNKNNQLKDGEKSQILQYFISKNISKISLENGKLIIEYNNNTKKTIESEDQELIKYHKIIQNLPNQSLSLSDLETENNSSSNNKNNNNLYKGLAIGIISTIALVGIILIIIRKKEKK